MIYPNTILQLLAMWKTFNTDSLESYLDSAITYRSAWVLFPLCGKAAVMAYLKTKLATLETATRDGKINLEAHLLPHNSYDQSPCIELTFEINLEIHQIWMLVKSKDQRITSIILQPKPSSQ